MSLAFTTTGRFLDDAGKKIAIYGPSGIGKSMQAATMPNPLIVAIEPNLLSLSRENIERVFGKDKPEICYDIPVIDISQSLDMQGVLDFLQGSKHAQRFNSVCFDSLSEYCERRLVEIRAKYKDVRLAFTDVWNETYTFIHKLKAIARLNILFTFKQEKEKDEASGAMLYMPSLPVYKLHNNLPFL